MKVYSTGAGRAILMGVGLVVAITGVAEAQRTIGGFPRSDQSDVTGPSVTSGDQVAPLFAEPGTVRSMGCSVAWGVRTASSQVRALLEASNLAPADVVSTLARGSEPVFASAVTFSAAASLPAYITAAAQANVLNLLGAGAEDHGEAPVLAALLTNNAGAARQARRLVSEARGLLAVMESLDPLQPGREGPTQLVRVTGAYNAFLDASADGFVASPPGELVALHAALGEMVSASIRNEGRPDDPNVVDASGLACAGMAPPIVPVKVPPPPADRPFEMCVLVNGDFRIAAGLVTPAGDSLALVNDRRVSFASVYTAASDVPTPTWVSRGDSVTIDGVRYQPFGVSRTVQPGDVTRRGYHDGHEYFGASGETGSPVIYFVSGAGCLVQPYRSVETIQVRG